MQYIQRVLSVFVYLPQSQLLSFLVDFHFFGAFKCVLHFPLLVLAVHCNDVRFIHIAIVSFCVYVYVVVRVFNHTVYTLMSGLLLFLFRFGQFLKVIIDRTQFNKIGTAWPFEVLAIIGSDEGAKGGDYPLFESTQKQLLLFFRKIQTTFPNH